MVETYKKIEGFENYSVSDFGNVRNDNTGKNLKGSDNGEGYLKVCLMKHKRRHSKLIHKLTAEAFLLNPENKKCIDHIDNNKLNNNLINLRFATHSQNQQNASLSSRNTSGTKGVRWNKKQNNWRAEITINGKTINLGSFLNKDDAINIRVQRAKDEFGEYINKCELVINV
jgi:hypothetical protein